MPLDGYTLASVRPDYALAQDVMRAQSSIGTRLQPFRHTRTGVMAVGRHCAASLAQTKARNVKRPLCKQQYECREGMRGEDDVQGR